MKILVLVLCFIAVVVQAAPSVKWTKSNLQNGQIAWRFPASEVASSSVTRDIAVAGDLPFHAGMFMDNSFFCGASLIAPDMVLTAAHCVDGMLIFDVYLGTLCISDVTEEGRVIVTSTHRVIYEGYNAFTMENDVALVKFPSPVELNERIGIIRLASSSAGDFAGEVATVSGWGKQSLDLQFTETQVLSNSACGILGKLSDTLICVDNIPCIADSGGPLTVTEADGERSDIGILSLIIIGCDIGMPGIFTRASQFVNWIYANGGPEPRP